MKRLTCLVLLYLFVCLSVFADYKLIWMWHTDDPRVTWFRYKINADEESDVDWIYVASPEAEPVSVVMDVEKNRTYTIRVQNSYDGVWWSQTSSREVDTGVLALFED